MEKEETKENSNKENKEKESQIDDKEDNMNKKLENEKVIKPLTPEEVAESLSAKSVIESVMKESINHNKVNEIKLDENKALRFEPVLYSDYDAVEANIRWDCHISLVDKETNSITPLYTRLSKDEELYSEDHKFEGDIQFAIDYYEQYFPLEQVYDLEEAMELENESPELEKETEKVIEPEPERNKTLDEIIAEAKIQKELDDQTMEDIDIDDIDLDNEDRE
jgi:hypothetical protein